MLGVFAHSTTLHITSAHAARKASAAAVRSACASADGRVSGVARQRQFRARVVPTEGGGVLVREARLFDHGMALMRARSALKGQTLGVVEGKRGGRAVRRGRLRRAGRSARAARGSSRGNGSWRGPGPSSKPSPRGPSGRSATPGCEVGQTRPSPILVQNGRFQERFVRCIGDCLEHIRQQAMNVRAFHVHALKP